MQLNTETLETVPTYDEDVNERLDPELAEGIRAINDEKDANEENPSSPPPIPKKTKRGYAKLKDLSPRNHNSPRPPSSSYGDDHKNRLRNDESNAAVVKIVHLTEDERGNNSSNNSKSVAKSAAKSVVSVATMGKGAKILVALLGVYAVFTTLTSGFFFDRFLDIPRLEAVTADLEAQVANLTAQVDRLENEVDELTTQIDRLEDAVDELSIQNDRYELNNQNLAGNLTIFKEENEELKTSIEDFTVENVRLNVSLTSFRKENDDLFRNIVDLNDQANALTDHVDDLNFGIVNLENVNVNLTSALNASEVLVENLNAENERLENTAEALNSSVVSLGFRVRERDDELARTDAALHELRDVVSFLNTTATDIDRTFDATVTLLDKLISEYRRNAIYNTRVFWEKLRWNWRCDLNSAFGGKPFTEDAYVPIGDESWPAVSDYLDEVVFQKMCFNMTDFERFLVGEYFPTFEGDDAEAPTGGNLTVQNLSGGIGWYAMGVFDHYFPSNSEDVEDAVTETEWEESGYDCWKLVADGRGYSFY